MRVNNPPRNRNKSLRTSERDVFVLDSLYVEAWSGE